MQRGAQAGNKNASHDKPWSDAIRRALLADDGKKLRTLAEKLVERAEGGDITALREIGDRIDGKPRQQMEVTGKDGADLIPPTDTLEVARRLGFILATAAQKAA